MIKYISSKMNSKINEYKLIKENNNKIKEDNERMQETIDNICNIKLEFTEISDKQKRAVEECLKYINILEKKIQYMDRLKLEKLLYILNLYIVKYQASNLSKPFEIQKCIFELKKLRDNIKSKLYDEDKQIKKTI